MLFRSLAKYNERDKDGILRSGDIIYLKKKQKKADKVYKKRPHTVKQGVLRMSEIFKFSQCCEETTIFLMPTAIPFSYSTVT